MGVQYVETNLRYRETSAETSRGIIHMRYYDVTGASQAILMVGGVGGGFDSPARDVYRKLAEEFQHQGISALRVQFRHPTKLDQAVYDVLAAIEFLQDAGVQRIALIGHSFGGAVVVSAAAASPAVVAVVTLAAQSHGAAADELRNKCLLIIHGDADKILHHDSSRSIYELATCPKDLRIFPGAGHALNEVASEVHEVMRTWLLAALAEP